MISEAKQRETRDRARAEIGDLEGSRRLLRGLVLVGDVWAIQRTAELDAAISERAGRAAVALPDGRETA